jgi:pre-mRNA-splicing factor CDC5/CEF1
MNYNIDIPFHAPAPAGFWDTTNEKNKEASVVKAPDGPVQLNKLEGQKRSAEEFEARKEDAKKMKQKRNDGDYVSAQALKSARDAELAISGNRRPLSLPAPQVSDRELLEIVKIGQSGQAAVGAVEGATSAQSLLGDYSARGPTPLRTPRVGEDNEQVESVKTMAKNLRAMVSSQTPLLGEDVDVQGDGGFTPRTSMAQTPNPVARMGTPHANGGEIVTRGDEVARPALRDQMGINTPREASGGFDDTPKRGGFDGGKRAPMDLASLFAQLPAPTNDFEIVIPDQDDDEEGEMPGGLLVPDQQDIHAAHEATRVGKLAKEYARRSTAVKRDLPRPYTIRPGFFSGEGKESGDALVGEEMLGLLRYDAVVYPGLGQVPSQHRAGFVELEVFEESRLKVADDLIKEELGEMPVIDYVKFMAMRDRIWQRYIFVPGEGKDTGRWKEIKKLGLEEHMYFPLINLFSAVLKTKIDGNREVMRVEAQKASKLEDRIGKLIAPHQEAADGLSLQHAEVLAEVEGLERDLAGFEHLAGLESAACIERVEKGQKELEGLLRVENELQREYSGIMENRGGAGGSN